MNSKQRRKVRRKWRYTAKISRSIVFDRAIRGEMLRDFGASCFRIDWDKGAWYIKFTQERDLVMFLLKFS